MSLSRKAYGLLLAAALAAAAAPAGAVAADGSPGDRQAEIRQAIAAAVKFLSSQIGPDGQAVGEYKPSDLRRLFGGKTALCAYALLTAGESPQRSAAARRAVDWLTAAKLDGVYPVAMRACALSCLSGAKAREALEADVRWLVAAANADGAYTYTPQGGRRGGTYDNSSSQIAVAGVWAGASRGIEVPRAYWEKVRSHWLSEQQEDGGWGYRAGRAGRAGRTRTYGSMSAAGLASLYACYDALGSEQFARLGASSEFEPMAKALKWLAANFRADENPRHGVEWRYYWLFCVQRVGLASGYKYFGAEDWYASGVHELLRRRHDDGSWGTGDAPDRVVPTAMSLLFLARGWHPVLFNKLQYTGTWNSRPRDLANFTRWLSYTVERPVAWQVVGLNAALEDWHDAPILYISGAGACGLSKSQVQKLRDFVLQGGMVLSEAARNSGSFTLDIQQLYRKLFPHWPMERLSDDHPIYSMQFPTGEPVGLSGVSNGVRLLAVHSPRDLSMAMQLGPKEANLHTFNLMANIYLYATDRGMLRQRGASSWPKAIDFKPAATIRVARIEHDGNCDPEPLAWQRLAILAARRHAIRLDVSELMPPAKLDPKAYPLAAMTGTKAFLLDPDQAGALARYLVSGGTLIIDAAGGSADFADSVRKQVLPLVAGGTIEMLRDNNPIYSGMPAGRVLFRRDYARRLGRAATRPRIRGVHDGERLVVFFSPEDITGALVGYPCHKLPGYTPEAAADLTIRLLARAAGVKLTPARD